MCIKTGGKVQGHHQIISYNILIKHIFSTKTVFSAYFKGLFIQRVAV